jgi:hypothetical protein
MPRVHMLKLFTIFLLALAGSPYTAPFQTYSPSPTDPPALIDDSPGSVIAPLTTDAGRLTIALPSEPATTQPVSLSVGGSASVLIADNCNVCYRSIFATILRV